MNWVSQYIGIPYLDHGRDLHGLDCWGLVRLVYRDQLNIELPSYAEISAEDLLRASRAITAGAEGEIWRPVEQSATVPFDVAVMRYAGRRATGHVGIVTPCNRILHCEQTTGTVLAARDHFTIRERLTCFRRHMLTAR